MTKAGHTTILVEPNPLGHRFQAVADVAEIARRSGDVVLLTSAGAKDTEWYGSFLKDEPIEVIERYDSVYPPTREMARGIAEVARECERSTAVVMDADESLKRWWYAAALEFRGLPSKPRVVFMLTRYIARLELTDWAGWRLKLSKAVLAALAMATRSLHRAAGFAGRDDFAKGSASSSGCAIPPSTPRTPATEPNCAANSSCRPTGGSSASSARIDARKSVRCCTTRRLPVATTPTCSSPGGQRRRGRVVRLAHPGPVAAD